MVSSARWLNVSDSLSKTIQHYQTIGASLETNTVLMSQEVFALLVDWKGKAPIAFTDSQQQSARDAYRVAQALMDAAFAMAALQGTIEANYQVIVRYQSISGFVADNTEVTTITTQYNTAIAAIQEKATTLGGSLSTVGQTLGTTCSTGKESLPPGQIDGVLNFYDENGKVVLVSQASNQQKNKVKEAWLYIVNKWKVCTTADEKKTLAFLIGSGMIASVLSAASSWIANSYVALGGGDWNTYYNNLVYTPKGQQIGGSNASQGLLGVITTILSATLGCMILGKAWSKVLIAVFAPLIGGYLIGYWVFVRGINPRFNPPPKLPPEPTQALQEATIAEIQQELKDPLTKGAHRNSLMNQYKIDVNAYYNEFGVLPPGYVPDPTPTSTPTPGVTPVPGLTPYQPTGKSTPVPGLTPFK